MNDAETLARQVALWLDDAETLEASRTAAKAHAASLDTALDEVVDRLCTALQLDRSGP